MVTTTLNGYLLWFLPGVESKAKKVGNKRALEIARDYMTGRSEVPLIAAQNAGEAKLILAAYIAGATRQKKFVVEDFGPLLRGREYIGGPA